MGIRSYAIGVLLGLLAFVAQLATIGMVNFFRLAERTSALASHALQQIVRSPEALLWLGYYALLGVIAHALPFLLATKITGDLREARTPRIRTAARQRGTALLIVLIMFASLLAWDRWLFPRTLVIGNGSMADMAWLPVGIATTLLAALLLVWLTTAASRRAIVATLAIPALILTTAFYTPAPERASSNTAPNIIVLGVDSLRPDHLATFGHPRPVTPRIDNFVAEAVNFRQAYTPMGRTFVAYSSILSGQYPVRHGVRENLYPRTLFNRSLLLPTALHQRGYRTVFALDEVRFANISQEFGFDQVITPPPGAVELLAGTLFDTAATNLLQLLPGMANLLPHVTGNRARHEGYVPAQQDRKIATAILAVPTNRPLLLVAHFTMPHIPFARGPWPKETLPPPYGDSPPAYRKALAIADHQIGATLDALRRAGRLDNAIVVMLSDHGEGLSMAKDEWKPDERYRNHFNLPQNFGHGGMALESAQAHVVLAIQRYVQGKPAWPSAQMKIQTSLVDVTPSLLQLTGVPYDRTRVDGEPLLAPDGALIATSRPVFVESGIFGQALETVDVDEQAVANEFVHLYRVTDDLRMELRPAALPNLLENKQRGVIWRGYGVSTMPEATAAGCWLVVDYKRRTRTCVEHARDHPVVDAYSRLVCQQFAADQAFRKRWCNNPTARPG